jgi:hypothetical protein
MARSVRLAVPALLTLCGCLPLEQFRSESTDLAEVPTSPFPPSAAQTVKRARLNYTPASPDMGMRVDAVGRKLVAANPLSVVKPTFATIGAPAPEIFHVDPTIVYVTEGLVKQCNSEAELAAVLASEMGKMVSEREASISRAARVAEAPLPIALPIGSQGDALASDPSRIYELAKYEQEHPKSARKKIVPPPDPRLVAQGLLENAGFRTSDLDAVAPVLRSAEQNSALERQFKGVMAPGGASWQSH